MSSSAPKRKLALEATVFTYAEAGLPSGDPNAATGTVTRASEAEERIRRTQTEAFEQGRLNGQQQSRAEFETAIAKSREQISHVLEQFTTERKNYYRRIESEVVELALAIARKILYREAQLDPNLLAAIVRITLEKLDAATKVSLHVHPREGGDWRHYFAGQKDGVAAPDVYDDPAIAAGECRIETSVGSTEVGLEWQLKEIGTGLLDLLSERPGTVPITSRHSTPNPPEHENALK
jgi:flagellar assembly protein FliH